MDARRPIGLARGGVHGPDTFSARPRRQQHGQTVSGAARRSIPPLETPSTRAMGAIGKTGLVCAHEPEDPDGSVPVSRANQAAAFDKMSRSSRRWRTSRRSRANSSRSAAARPGAASSRRPSCLSASANPGADRMRRRLETRGPGRPEIVRHAPRSTIWRRKLRGIGWAASGHKGHLA